MIKVADFGLSEIIDSSRNYSGQDSSDDGRVPVKWMAPESIAVFSEKTDVVRTV